MLSVELLRAYLARPATWAARSDLLPGRRGEYDDPAAAGAKDSAELHVAGRQRGAAGP
jgi:hypothetical protein